MIQNQIFTRKIKLRYSIFLGLCSILMASSCTSVRKAETAVVSPPATNGNLISSSITASISDQPLTSQEVQAAQSHSSYFFENPAPTSTISSDAKSRSQAEKVVRKPISKDEKKKMKRNLKSQLKKAKKQLRSADNQRVTTSRQQADIDWTTIAIIALVIGGVLLLLSLFSIPVLGPILGLVLGLALLAAGLFFLLVEFDVIIIE